MKIAYMIITHDTPDHLPRLIRALDSEAATFFIHLDRKYPDHRYRSMERPHIRLLRNRVAVHWGEYSQVEAILRMLRAAFDDPAGHERFVLLSGADYPVRSRERIEAFFARYPDREFLTAERMPMPHKPLWRLERRQVLSSDPAPWRGLQGWLQARKLLPAERDYRKALGDLAPHAGAGSWAITRDACGHLLDFVGRNRRVVRFFRNTVCPDEMFFHTILANSPYRTKLAGTVTYSDWSRGRPRPEVISNRHLEIFRCLWGREPEIGDGTPGGSEEATVMGGEVRQALFARKFPDQSGELVQALQRLIDEHDRGPSAR